MSTAKREAFEQIQNRIDETNFMVKSDSFRTPDMGDYYINATDDPYFKIVDKLINERENSDLFKFSFYAETPAVTALGTHERENVYFIKVRIIKQES